MKFKGTIIITDPCYFAKDNDWGTEFEFNDSLINPELGFTDYIWISTGFGDTSGIVINSENNLNWGEFSVDSGTYGVFYLSEVESYNPGKAQYFREHPKLATIIENYTGDIEVLQKSADICNINCIYGHNFIATP